MTRDAPPSISLMLRLFGSFEVLVNGQPMMRPRASAGQWILALLALHQQPVDRIWLASVLWPDSSHEQALYNLRRNLSDLRQLLGDEAHRLASPTPRTLSLNLDGAGCDVREFDALVQRTDSEALREAIALYRGTLLEECREDWATLARATREQAFLSALETLAVRAMQAGDHSEAIAHFQQILAVDVYHEAALCQLLQALAAVGDFVAATLAYREFRMRLHEELQTQPAPETQAIYRSLRQHRVEGRSQSVPPLRIPENRALPPLHLPQPLSGLVGREEEIRQVQNALKKARLVSLIGAGGIGKTRLAIAVAGECADDFQDGIWFVDLTPLSEAALVPFAVVNRLSLQDVPGRSPMETLCEQIASKELLLVIDNCEHLMEACVSLIQTLLQACPGLQILVTSRQTLGLSGEIVWQVPPLAFPTEQEPPAKQGETATPSAKLERFDAVRLFAERAGEACPSFTVHSRNIATVACICRRLDGIPLALELAAARMRSLSLEEIYARLRTNFGLLRGGIGTPTRHETLAATFAWSWDLLDPQERLLLERLSVFAGGWSVATAEAVCAGDDWEQAEIVDLLSGLVDKSLVLYRRNGTNSSEAYEARYSLLETTRQFAVERLRERSALVRVNSRHRDHFLAWAEEISPKLWGAEQAVWFERMETEHNNLRAALEWCRKQGDIEQEFRFVITLSRFWDTHGHLHEGRTHLETALGRATPQLPPTLRADVLVNVGWMAHIMGDNAASRLYCEQALVLCQQLGYEFHLSGLLNFLGCVYQDEKDFAKARSFFEQSRLECLRLNDQGRLAAVLNNLGVFLLREGEISTAQAYLEEGADLCRKLESNQLLGVTLHNLAVAALRLEHDADALTYNAASLRVCYESRALVNLPEVLDLMAILACRLQQWNRTSCLLGAAEGLHRTLGVPPESILVSDLEQATSAVRLALGVEAFAAGFTEGIAMDLDEAVSYALEGSNNPMTY